jgi:hypothetical protein
MTMDIEKFLSQPPVPVRDDGFSQHVLLTLYQERLRHRNVVLAAGAGVVLLAFIILPIAILVPAFTLQLTALIASPFTPWLGAVAAILLLAFRPGLLRF